MKIVKGKGLAKPIILLKILEDKRALVVDSQATIRFLKVDSFDLLGGFKLGIKYRHYKTSVISFCDDASYFATVTSTAREAKLFNTKTKKLISKMGRNHGEVTVVAIDPLKRYMFSCGDDGKSFVVDIESGKFIFTLPHHSDTINDIAFSKDGNWVATASYDRKISLFSLSTLTPKNVLKSHSDPVMHLSFFHENKLLSIDKNASAIIWNIYDGKVFGRLEGIHDSVESLFIDKEERFLFLGTTLGYIIVYDLETLELISSQYIKLNSEILSIAFDEDNSLLLLGTQKGELLSYDIFEGLDYFKALLKKRAFKDIEALLKKNPLLKYTQPYSDLESFWSVTLQKAKLILQNGDRDKAMLLFGEFRYMSNKNGIIQKLLKEYEEFPKFTALAKSGKLALAYALANKYPSYQESSIYKALEKRWKRSFSEAQRALLDPRGAQQAKDMLAPYRGISEKTRFIQDLFAKSDVYRQFREALSKKEFHVCFELVRQNSFLKELPEYESLVKYGDSLYEKAKKSMDLGEIHQAIKLLRVLEDFEMYKNEARKFTLDLESKAKFFAAIKDEDIATAFDMMENVQSLLMTPEGRELESMWSHDLHLANAAAAQAKIGELKKILDKYMKIHSKYIALATIFSFAYMVELESSLQKGVQKSILEKGIKNYILNFGVTEQIEVFYNLFKESYPDTKLNLELLTKGSFSMWRPSMIVNSILD